MKIFPLVSQREPTTDTATRCAGIEISTSNPSPMIAWGLGASSPKKKRQRVERVGRAELDNAVPIVQSNLVVTGWSRQDHRTKADCDDDKTEDYTPVQQSRDEKPDPQCLIVCVRWSRLSLFRYSLARFLLVLPLLGFLQSAVDRSDPTAKAVS